MFDFHEKRKIRRIVYSKTVFVLLVCLAVFLSTAVYHRYVVATDTKEKLEERRVDLEALQLRAEVLNTKVEYLENERGIEEELRNRFDVAKEGEQVVVIIDDRENREPTATSETNSIIMEEESLGKNLLKLFKFW